jgi:hypothetical protein
MADGELYTFTTGSKGGRDAVGDLCKAFGGVMAQHPDEYPVVAIGVRSYEHPNRSYGRIKTPEFKIVGWLGKDTFAADLGEVEPGDEPMKPEPAPAPAPKPAKPTPVPPAPSPVEPPKSPAAKKAFGRI